MCIRLLHGKCAASDVEICKFERIIQTNKQTNKQTLILYYKALIHVLIGTDILSFICMTIHYPCSWASMFGISIFRGHPF